MHIKVITISYTVTGKEVKSWEFAIASVNESIVHAYINVSYSYFHIYINLYYIYMEFFNIILFLSTF